jgi:general secretion pathway protein C
MRLEFGKSAQPQMASTAANVAAPAASSEREQTLQFQLALAPQRSNGRTIGYAIRKGADLPALRGAGLRPGDVITAVNGSVLDEERLQELSWQIANSDRVEFDYSRGGRKMKATLGAAK